MIDLSHREFDRNFALARASQIRLILPVVILLAVAVGGAVFWEFYGGRLNAAVVSPQEGSADVSPVARELQASQAVEQVQALQQDLAAQQTATKRLSDQVTALSLKVDVLQQSFESPPPVAKPPPLPRKKPVAPLSIRP